MKTSLPSRFARPARPPGFALPPRRPWLGSALAFTLVEMMVVIGIIVIVLAIALPNLRGFREGQEMDAATRQLMADLSLARARAIGGRTTVAVVFIPSDIFYFDTSSLSQVEADQVKRRQAGIYTEYTLFAFRRAGDQPGQSSKRYLTPWKTLPEKTFIAENKFMALSDTGIPQFDYADFPFPLANTPISNNLPYVAFNFEGRPCRADGNALPTPQDIVIPLARGAIFYSRDSTGGVTNFTVQETPPGNSVTFSNHVVIDWLSGRPHLQRTEVR